MVSMHVTSVVSGIDDERFDHHISLLQGMPVQCTGHLGISVKKSFKSSTHIIQVRQSGCVFLVLSMMHHSNSTFRIFLQLYDTACVLDEFP